MSEIKRKNIGDSYKVYLEATKDPVSIKDYRQINNLYMKFLSAKVLQGRRVMLPNKMGIISIEGRRPNIKFKEDGSIKGLSPNWPATIKLWNENPEMKKKKKKVFYTNEHTDGYNFIWKWRKRGVIVKNKSLYSLKMSRTNKRAVNKQIRDGVNFITRN